MTETTKARTEKHTISPAASPQDAMPKYGPPQMEVPAGFREFAEKGVAQARENYQKIQSAAEEATNLLQDSYATAAKGATDYNLKVIEIARINTNTAFDFANRLLAAKSPSEFIELSTAQTRKQFEAMTAQTKELTELAQKLTTELVEPLKTGMTKAFNNRLSGL